MWIFSIGKFRKWNDSSMGIILLGDSVLKGNGMASDPSEKKRNRLFLKPSPLSALENTELFLLAAGVSISREREKPLWHFSEPSRISKAWASVSRFAVDPNMQVFTRAIMLGTEESAECARIPSARGRRPAPHSFLPYSLLQGDGLPSYLSVSVCLSECSDVAPSQANGSGGEQSNFPTEEDNLRCWYISLVFYVLLSSRSHVEMEIFLF